MKVWDKAARGGVALLGIILLAFVTCLLPSRSLAQSQGSPAQGLQISPVLIDLNAQAGKTYTLKITVTNITAQQLVVKPAINDFKAKDETGNPQVITDTNEDNSAYSLRAWATLSNQFTLKPKENRVVNVMVSVPPNAEAGGHYGVVRFTAVPADSADSNVTISASVGTLILARVEGNIEEKLSVKELLAEKNSHKGSVFETTPQLVVERLENSGNVHLRPQGTVTIKNTFGKTIFTADINKQGGSVLPHSTRRYEQPVNKRLFIGRYTMEINATYGTHGGVLVASTTFWVIPFKFIIICLILLVILAFILKRGVKGYNKRIIAKAQRSNHK